MVVVVYGERLLIICSPICANSIRSDRLVVDDLDDQPPFVKAHIVFPQLFQHVMWYGLLLEMLDENAHLGVVAETTILLVEPKVGRVEVHYQRWRPALVLGEDVLLRDHVWLRADARSFVRVLCI